MTNKHYRPLARFVPFSIGRERRQQVPRVVVNPALRHQTLPICHVRIVSKCKNTCGRDLGGEEGLGLRLGRAVGGPCLLTIAGQAVYEDDAAQKPSVNE